MDAIKSEVGHLKNIVSPTSIIFIVGPSGVGKSEISKWIEDDFHFLHLNIDISLPFHTYRLQSQWHLFSNQLDPIPLISALHNRITNAGRSGIVLSFPSTRILTREQVDVAKPAGICTVVLWGPEGLCKEARRARDIICGRAFNEKRYDRSNREAFSVYVRSEYADMRVETFRPDGTRVPLEQISNIIRQKVTSQ